MGNCFGCISGISRRKYDDGQCVLCCQSHVTKSRLKCGHVFCYQCLVNWSKIKLECPTCEQPFTQFRHQTIGSPENGKLFDQLYDCLTESDSVSSTGSFDDEDCVCFCLICLCISECMLAMNRR